MEALNNSMCHMKTEEHSIMIEKQNTEAETRVKKNLFGSLLKEFERTAGNFQAIQSEIKQMMQTRIIRDAEIVLNKELQNDEKKEILENPLRIQTLYVDKLSGPGHVKLQNAVADLEERHIEIIKIEKV
jgi:hypothetical protein